MEVVDNPSIELCLQLDHVTTEWNTVSPASPLRQTSLISCHNRIAPYVERTAFIEAITVEKVNKSGQKCFDERPHRTSCRYCDLNDPFRCAVTDYGIIPFAAYTAAETPNAYQLVGPSPKISPFREDVLLVPWAHPIISPQTAHRSVHPFLQVTYV